MPVIFESTQLLGIIVRACVLSCTAAQYYRHLLSILSLLSQSPRVLSSGNEQHDVCLYDVCLYDVCLYDVCMYDACLYDVCLYDVCMYACMMYACMMYTV